MNFSKALKLFVLLPVVLGCYLHAGPQYILEKLPDVNSCELDEMMFLNDQGEIAGDIEQIVGDNFIDMGCIYNPSTESGWTLGGENNASLHITGLNNAGQAVGTVEEKGFIFTPGSGLRTILILGAEGDIEPLSINNHSQVLVEVHPADEMDDDEDDEDDFGLNLEGSTYYIWDEEHGETRLALEGMFNNNTIPCPLKINDRRQILMLLVDTETSALGFCLWEDGKIIKEVMPQRDQFDFGITLNQEGDVAGVHVETSGDKGYGMIWTCDGEVIQVDPLTAEGSYEEEPCLIFTSINTSRQAVGRLDISDSKKRLSCEADEDTHAVIWTKQDGVQDLNDCIAEDRMNLNAPWAITEAISINNRGQILVLVEAEDDTFFNALLTPQ